MRQLKKRRQVAMAELLCGGRDTFFDREQVNNVAGWSRKRRSERGVYCTTVHYRKTLMSLSLKKDRVTDH